MRCLLLQAFWEARQGRFGDLDQPGGFAFGLPGVGPQEAPVPEAAEAARTVVLLRPVQATRRSTPQRQVPDRRPQPRQPEADGLLGGGQAADAFPAEAPVNPEAGAGWFMGWPRAVRCASSGRQEALRLIVRRNQAYWGRPLPAEVQAQDGQDGDGPQPDDPTKLGGHLGGQFSQGGGAAGTKPGKETITRHSARRA
jgi:hypothetical protein